jgi:hypothetical protein
MAETKCSPPPATHTITPMTAATSREMAHDMARPLHIMGDIKAEALIFPPNGLCTEHVSAVVDNVSQGHLFYALVLCGGVNLGSSRTCGRISAVIPSRCATSPFYQQENDARAAVTVVRLRAHTGRLTGCRWYFPF